MYFPTRYKPLHLVRLNDQQQPIDWPETYSYVPPGFYWFPAFELGNGDVHGFYWPIGREKQEPIVCETYHDGAHLEPHASTFEGRIRVRWANGFHNEDDLSYQEVVNWAGRLDLPLNPPRFTENYEAPPLIELLSADPQSPAVRIKAAKDCLARSDLDAAEIHLISALRMLPEYTEAHWLLAGIFRRTKRPAQAAEQMLHVLRCPPCFGGDAGKCLHWLQRYRDEFPELADDPLWLARHRLTFKRGEKFNDDYLIYQDAIASYLNCGKFFEAVTMRLTYGALMLRETHPFRERYGFTWPGHLQHLKEDFVKAGLHERAEILTTG